MSRYIRAGAGEKGPRECEVKPWLWLWYFPKQSVRCPKTNQISELNKESNLRASRCSASAHQTFSLAAAPDAIPLFFLTQTRGEILIPANLTCKQNGFFLFHNRFSEAKQKSRQNSPRSRILSSPRAALWTARRWIGRAYVLIKIIGGTANSLARSLARRGGGGAEWFI